MSPNAPRRPGLGCGTWVLAGRELVTASTAATCSSCAICWSPPGRQSWSRRGQPFGSASWCAALAVVLDRSGGDPPRLGRLGPAGLTQRCAEDCRAGVDTRLPAHRGWGLYRTDRSGRCRSPTGRVPWSGPGCWPIRGTPGPAGRRRDPDGGGARRPRADRPGHRIDGVSPVGAAAILAETGDPARFDSPRALVKHAGLCPRDNASGHRQANTRISGSGRPALRLAAWRAVWAALPNNPVIAARFRHLTTRETTGSRQQARAAIAAALLRWLHVITTRRITWDATLAGAEAELVPSRPEREPPR